MPMNHQLNIFRHHRQQDRSRKRICPMEMYNIWLKFLDCPSKHREI